MQVRIQTVPQSDALGKYFAESVGLHAAIIGVIVLSGMWKLSGNNWGADHASSGSVGVTMVTSIPIPHRDAPENLLANDSQSNVPQAPAPVKTAPQVKAPDPKAIPIPDKILHKVSPKVQSNTVYRPHAAEYNPNQVYSQTPQAASSQQYATKGANGIDIGPATVLGFKFGAYVGLMHDRIAAKWNTADVRALPSQRAGITFTIARDGSVSDVKVSHPSGSFDLDTSAKRAVLDASPLPALPPDVPKNEATVELWFQLKQ
jgi:protein TonB